MQTLDVQVLQNAREWLHRSPPWLCTIVRTLGSSPRPVGSLVAIADDLRQTGSVSGGCVEEDLLEKLQRGEYPAALPTMIEYGVSAEENARLGLPCGGRLTLLLQKLQARDAGWLDAVLAALAQRRCIERHLTLADGVTRTQAVADYTGLAFDRQALRQCFGPRMRLLLIGAGELARSLAELALAMDYEVIVTDPREDFLRDWNGPPVQLVPGMPDDVVRRYAGDPHLVVITLTHDPRIDDMGLMEALESSAWYVGALGSRRTSDTRLARLAQLGIDDAALARLHAPVGLDIGSKTPIEIAVSIMAQITALRRQPRA
ncbi:MAG: XdhC family protein [Halioglobus sp.]